MKNNLLFLSIRLKLIPFFLLFFTLFSSAQEVPLKYSMRENNPESVKYFSIGVDPIMFYGVRGRSDFMQSLHYQINGEYFLNNKLVFSGYYTRSYIHPNSTDAGTTQESGIGINGVSSNSEFMILGKYFFMDNVVAKKEDVYYNHTKGTDYYVRIDAKQRRMLGLRGGYIFNNSYVTGSFIGKDNTGNTSSIPNVITMAQYHAISLGLSYTILSDVIIDLDGYGTRKEESTNEFYFDLLVLPSVNLDDVAYTIPNPNGPSTTATYNINSNSNPQKWGLKAGYITSGNNHLGLRIGVEGGLLPVTGAGYFLIRAGLNFSKRI